MITLQQFLRGETLECTNFANQPIDVEYCPASSKSPFAGRLFVYQKYECGHPRQLAHSGSCTRLEAENYYNNRELRPEN